MRATKVLLKQAGNLSGDMTGSLTFGPQSLEQIYGYAIQAVYTGAPAGTLKLQGSIDGINYCDIPNTPFTVTSAGSFIWDMTASSVPWVQMVWTPTGGSGTLTALAWIRGF